jgi:hypothetical protein
MADGEFIKHGMTQARFDFLMQPFEDENFLVMLTAEELKSGWHWCDEWDGLLIHTEDVEFKHCKCEFMNKFRKDRANVNNPNKR